jgi:NADH dehydrogenase (ubiquinone) 1 beta subcomplex subunit 5
MSGHNIMSIKETKWQSKKFRDLIHYYVLVGVIPLTLLITYVNVFIGPAKLAPIPDGYRPKHWEYYKVSYFFMLIIRSYYCRFISA